jgi:GMP synthase-like glutamine amidotransferase
MISGEGGMERRQDKEQGAGKSIHWLQHVEFEGLGSIEGWARERGHGLSRIRLFGGDPLPKVDVVDLLIVMGGPMGVHDEEQYPWLVEEKAFLREVLGAGIPVLGICLGAQLLAHVLGAAVTANGEKEIGWFPVLRGDGVEAGAVPEALARILPAHKKVFHWHGDTFSLPEGSVRLYSSAACVNQAFFLDRVIGLQFHLETTPAGLAALVENCRRELVLGLWVQSEEELVAGGAAVAEINVLMEGLLDYLLGQGKGQGGAGHCSPSGG